MKSLPLRGVRIISFEQFGAGPYATMFLADLGAEVLKVEPPHGDHARHTSPRTLGENDSLYFQSFNINKKSIQLNLKCPNDRRAFHALVRKSSAVINNLRGSIPARLGVDYMSLRDINPQIICGHISAYGRDNGRRERPGYDFLMQAEAGLMEMTGDPGSPPTRFGASMIDYMSGMMLALGVVSAIRGAERCGKGGDVDVSLFDVALHQLGYQASWYLNAGLVTAKTPRSAHPTNTPVQLFKTRDGWVYIAAMTEKFWKLLLAQLDCPKLAADARFHTPESRLKFRAELTQALDEIFTLQTTEKWVEKLASSVPIAPVYGIEHALSNPFVEEAQMINQVDHPSQANIRILANPIRLDGKRVPQKAAPQLGEHNEFMRDLVEREDK
jgi:crotonobetainyl-CoA:carnitine CoA-transferase CaiB-like acyl-CoA transferase